MFWLRFLIAAAGAYLLAAQILAQGCVALVVGISAYLHSAPLANPVNDASDMAAALKEVGFAVLLGLDLDKRGFDTKMREFGQALENWPTPGKLAEAKWAVRAWNGTARFVAVAQHGRVV
jgi:Caspase domain